MRGNVDAAYLESIGVGSPDAVVRELEESLRALLRDLVCGHLAPDLVGIAEELLALRPPIAQEQDAPAPAPPPEADFVVRRQVAPAAPRRPRRSAACSSRPPMTCPRQTSATRSLDDDAADYSAAV